MYYGWLINEAEILDILNEHFEGGFTWKEWRHPDVQSQIPPHYDLSISELRRWRLFEIRDKFFPQNLRVREILMEELTKRYENRRERIKSLSPSQIEARLPIGLDISVFEGKKVIATALCEIMGMRWRSFCSMIDRGEFPEPDSSSLEYRKGKWWWATTLIKHFPDDVELIDGLGWRYVKEWSTLRPW